MEPRVSWPRRLRARVNRRFYAALFRAYRTIFSTPRWEGRIPPASLRRILIMQRYGVGDMVLTTPLIAFVREYAPTAEIDVLASSRNAAVVAGDPRLTRVFAQEPTRRSWLRTVRQLRARRYDLIFVGQEGEHVSEGITASLAAHRHAYKVSTWRPKRYQGFFTTTVRARASSLHTAERLLRMGGHALGVPPLPTAALAQRYPPRIARDPGAEERVAAFVAGHNLVPFVAVNLTAAVAWRDWSPEQCGEFVTLLLERHPDLSVVLTPAPGKEEPTHEVARRCASRRVVVAPPFPLPDLVALVRQALAVVTPSTALLHIASACGRPVVALYAPRFPRDVTEWLPIGVPYRALASGFRGRTADIPAADVAQAFDELRAELHERSGAPAPSVT